MEDQKTERTTQERDGTSALPETGWLPLLSHLTVQAELTQNQETRRSDPDSSSVSGGAHSDDGHTQGLGRGLQISKVASSFELATI